MGLGMSKATTGAGSKTWTIIVDSEAEGWLGELMKKHPLVPRHKLLRLAMKHGLRKAAGDPALILAEHGLLTEAKRGGTAT